MIKKIDIRVIQQAINVAFECPKCSEDIEINYKGFCADVGEPCDWVYSKVDCPECGAQLEIDSVDWD